MPGDVDLNKVLMILMISGYNLNHDALHFDLNGNSRKTKDFQSRQTLTMASHSPIARLSVELFAAILEVADSPLDMVNLACTCKGLAHLTDAALRRHRDAYAKFRYTSDRNPHTIITLVRRLVLRRDSLVARHFRSFDVWGARLSWSEWRHFDVDEHGVKLASEEAHVDRLTPREVEQVLETAKTLFDKSELIAAREEVETGGDGFLKMLIIASAPRLESLKFIRRNDLLHKSCQAWLFKLIRSQLTTGRWKWLPGVEWPPGLRSLRELAVGVDAGVLDSNIDVVDENLIPDWEGPGEISAMMRLPSLTSLYYHTAAIPQEDDPDSDDNNSDSGSGSGQQTVRRALAPETPEKSSNVSQIYLDGVRRGSRNDSPVSDFYTNLLAMPRALRSCSVRMADDECDPANILFALSDFQQETLQKMMFYNPGSIVGYRCSAYRPEDVPKAPLTMWWQTAEDVGLQALYDREEGQATREDVVKAFLRYMDREHAEVIILDGPLEGAFFDDKTMAWSYYEDALLALIRSAGKRNLKALFIDFPHVPDSDGGLESPDGFAKVVRLAGELGVDLYGSKHLKAKRRHVLDFPRAPSKWDLVTGPYFGKRIEQGFTEYDCVGDNWSTPEKDEYAWHYVKPEADA